jgi:hypothetical protein
VLTVTRSRQDVFIDIGAQLESDEGRTQRKYIVFLQPPGLMDIACSLVVHWWTLLDIA